LLAACVFAQGLNSVDRLFIDDFTVGANQHQVEIELAATLTENEQSVIDDASFTENGCSGLIGCSRDMRIEVFTGFANREFTSEIFDIPNGLFDAEWAISNPKTSSSVCTLQYDGADESFDLDITGLGGVDLTVGGTADELFFAAVSDIEIEYTILFYDVDGGICELEVEIPATPGAYDYDETFYLFDIDDFDNGCDLTDIGAIEIFLPSSDAVDAIVRQIKFVGDPIPSETPTGTPTRTPEPTASVTPSPTPAPSIEECMCHCPIFTCALIFDPDDDENNAYYFDDDDEFQVVGSNGSVVYYDFESGSGAAMIQASALVVAVIAAFVL